MNNLNSYATIDNQSNILCQSDQFKNIFLNSGKLYDSPLLQEYKDLLLAQDQMVINSGMITKSLLINMYSQNFVLTKFPATIHDKAIGINIVIEEFRINNLKNFMNFSGVKCPSDIPKKFLNIDSYSDLQREIIFCLLINKHTDKSIAKFIELKKKKIVSPRSIKNAFHEIYNKLLTNDREDLTALCYKLNFDKCVPTTLYSHGIYNTSDIMA